VEVDEKVAALAEDIEAARTRPCAPWLAHLRARLNGREFGTPQDGQKSRT
jgi:hypothetical protein